MRTILKATLYSSLMTIVVILTGSLYMNFEDNIVAITIISAVLSFAILFFIFYIILKYEKEDNNGNK